MKNTQLANEAFPSTPDDQTTTVSRRKVVKTLAVGGAAMLLSPHSLFSACKPQKDKLGVALVGLGYYSTDLLAPALQQTKHC